MKSVFSEEFDELDENPIRCKSCNVQYSDHLGMTGTCQHLIEAKAENKVLRTAFCIRDDETVVASVEGSILIDNKGGTRRRYFVATDEERKLKEQLEAMDVELERWRSLLGADNPEDAIRQDVVGQSARLLDDRLNQIRAMTLDRDQHKGLSETLNAIALEKTGQITELRSDFERLKLRCAEADHELTEARKRCEELAKQVTERDTLILQLSDMVVVRCMEIRELKLDLEEGQ